MISVEEILLEDYNIGSTKSYDTSSILIGNLIHTYYDPSGSMYAQPLEYQYQRPYNTLGILEYNVRDGFKKISCVKYSDDIDYILSPSLISRAFYKEIFAYKFQKSKNEFTALGSVQISPRHIAGAVSSSFSYVSGYMYRYSSGSIITSSVGVGVTDITGSNTNWDFARICQGARIGFGTNNFEEVKDWYEIATVPSASTMTIFGELRITSSVQYVIEELKLVSPIRFTPNVGYNGVEIIHGLSEMAFSLPGNYIANMYTSSNQDRQRGYYRVAESETNTIAFLNANNVEFDGYNGSPTMHLANVTSYAGSFFSVSTINVLFPAISCSFSVTAPGTVLNPVDTILNRVPIAGTSASYTHVYAKTSHGPGSGSYNIYQTTSLPGGGTTPFRIYRTSLDNIRFRSGSDNYILDSMVEVPPGGLEIARYWTGGDDLRYIKSIDKFVLRSIGAQTGFYSKFSIFEYDPRFSKQIRQALHIQTAYDLLTTINDDVPKYALTQYDSTVEIATSDDMLYIAASSGFNTSLGQQILYGIPVGVDYQSAPKTKQWITFPPIDTSNTLYYKSIYIKSNNFIGPFNLGYRPEPIVPYYRTSGIQDDSGEWIRLYDNGDLSNIEVKDKIQFSVAFDVLGYLGLYNRVYGMCFTHEEGKTDFHYTPSIENSVIQSNIICWKQVRSWDGNIPKLTILIINTQDNSVVIQDYTENPRYGIFEYSSDNGITWNPYNSSASGIGYLLRYKANYLPANTSIKSYIRKS